MHNSFRISRGLLDFPRIRLILRMSTRTPSQRRKASTLDTKGEDTMTNATKATKATKATRNTVSVPVPVTVKAKGGPAWDANLTDTDRTLCRMAMDAAAGIDAAERNAAKAFQKCYSANLHGKAGFSDFARWATLAGEAYGLPDKAKASIYRLVNAGVALDCGSQSGDDLSDVPSHTLAAIYGTARKSATSPDGVPAIVRSKANEYRRARATGANSADAHNAIIGKPTKSAKASPMNAEERAKAIVSAVLRVSDSWSERVNALRAAITEVERLRKAAND